VPARRGSKTAARCPPCQREHDRGHNARRRAHDSYAEQQRRRATVRAWVATHGYVCPGWRRPPHPVDPQRNPLCGDHLHPPGAGGPEHGPLGVLCRRCNSAKGATTTR
jgi:5-methylcytosine-specific restriction protein A